MKKLQINSYAQLTSITEKEAFNNSIYLTSLKGYSIYLIETNSKFNLCLLVYKNGLLITTEQSYNYYKTRMDFTKHTLDYFNKILFTEEEILSPLKNYSDYFNRFNFILNILPRQFIKVSIFHSIDYTKEEQEIVKNGFLYNFNYFKNKHDANYIKNLNTELSCNYKLMMLNDLDFFKSAVTFELSNHEAGITCDYENALDALNIKFEDLSSEKQKIVIKELNRLIYKNH